MTVMMIVVVPKVTNISRRSTARCPGTRRSSSSSLRRSLRRCRTASCSAPSRNGAYLRALTIARSSRSSCEASSRHTPEKPGPRPAAMVADHDRQRRLPPRGPGAPRARRKLRPGGVSRSPHRRLHRVSGIAWLKTPKGRSRVTACSSARPSSASLLQMIAVARFSKTLATLLASGVQLLRALEIVRAVIGNAALRRSSKRPPRRSAKARASPSRFGARRSSRPSSPT